MSATFARSRGPLRGEVSVPGDKSIAHRWLILAATARGTSRVLDVPSSLDVRSTARSLEQLLPRGAVEVDVEGWPARPVREGAVDVHLTGTGFDGLRPPDGTLDCGNSGTTMRLLAGALADRPFAVTLDGDASLRRRPMERVAAPLRAMGARVETRDGRPPLRVSGGGLRGIEHRAEVPSAQVKAAILLAGLQAEGATSVVETVVTRDHTERALAALGAPVRVEGTHVEIEAHQHEGFTARVPGDVSSAAYLAAAAALVPGSEVSIEGVGLNPTRSEWIDRLASMGVHVETALDHGELGEPCGRLTVRASDGVRPLELEPDDVARAIDEIPILAVVSAFAKGESRFRGAGELRVKESNRLDGIADGIRALGGGASVEGDDLVIGGGGLTGGRVDARGDHRMAMAFAVAGLAARDAVEVDGREWADVSCPGFAEALAAIGAARS